MPSDAFLIQDGKEFGPFSPSQLKHLADAGRIQPDDLIRKGEDGQPIPARQIAGLNGSFLNTGHHPPPQKPNPATESSWVGDVLAPDDEAVCVAPVPKKLPPRVERPVAESQAKPSWLTTERVPPHFDPYHVWLGVPKGKRPPTHYHLLRIASTEHADELIEGAAERQAEYVRKCRIGEYAGLADRILYEIEEAKLCLLDPRLRREYDEKLAEGKQKPEKKRVLPPPGRPVGEGNEIATTYFKIVSILTAAFLLTAVVSFMLPWKKVVFSKSQDETEAANIGAAPAVPQAAALPIVANVPPKPNALAKPPNAIKAGQARPLPPENQAALGQATKQEQAARDAGSPEARRRFEQSLPGKYRIELAETGSDWTDNSNTVGFHADKTFTLSDGHNGTWSIKDEQIIVTSPDPDLDVQPLTRGNDGVLSGTVLKRSNGHTFRQRLVPATEETGSQQSESPSPSDSTQGPTAEPPAPTTVPLNEFENSLVGKYRLDFLTGKHGSRTLELHADKTLSSSDGHKGTWDTKGDHLVLKMQNILNHRTTRYKDGTFHGSLTDKGSHLTLLYRMTKTQ